MKKRNPLAYAYSIKADELMKKRQEIAKIYNNTKMKEYILEKYPNVTNERISNILDDKLTELAEQGGFVTETINSDLLQIDWKKPAKGISPSDILNNNLTSIDVGYTVKYDGQILTSVQQYLHIFFLLSAILFFYVDQ